MSAKPLLVGSSILALICSLIYVKMDSLLKLSLPPAGSNSIFNSILSSFSVNEEHPIVSLRNDFGLSITRPLSVNQSIFSIPLETSSLVIDGTHNVPTQFHTLQGFGALSTDARTILSIAVFKITSDEFSNSFSQLWKGVGVAPIPDSRWVRYRGLFSLDTNATGIQEIDRYVNVGHQVISECMQFVKANSLQRVFYSLNEAELRWSWIFLNAFGVRLDGHKALVAPLVFARHTVDAIRAVGIETKGNKVRIFSRKKMDRGEELLIDGRDEISDGFAFLFHGSWVADDSIHRGRFWIPLITGGKPDGTTHELLKKQGCVDEDNLLAVWLSTDLVELGSTRNTLTRCSLLSVLAPNQTVSADKQIKASSRVVSGIKSELSKIQPTDTVKFQYFNLLFNELIFWEALKAKQTREAVDL